MKKRTLFAAWVALSVAVAPAASTVIDFEPIVLSASGFTALGRSYSEDGFQLYTGCAYGGLGATQAAGSTAIYNDCPGGGLTTLYSLAPETRIFDVYSVDVAHLSLGVGFEPFTVTFVGGLFAGGTVQQSFTVVDVGAFQTLVLTGFQDVTYVNWERTGGWASPQIDNICIGTDACQSVPEPSTLALLSLGLAGLALTRRRKH